MKRIVFSLVLLALFSAFVLAAVSTETALQYNSTTHEVTFNVSRGWNMLPIGDGILTSSDPQDPNYCETATSIFVWDSFSKEYVGGAISKSGPNSADAQRASDVMNSAKELGYAFGSMGAAWAYLASPCKMTMSFSGNALTGEEGKKVLRGWNFITIMPWMINKKFSDVAPDCDITKANVWDDTYQKWSQESSRETADTLMAKATGMPIKEMDVGTTLVVYAESGCELTTGSAPIGPPVLPA